jgi:hypothetical protein
MAGSGTGLADAGDQRDTVGGAASVVAPGTANSSTRRLTKAMHFSLKRATRCERLIFTEAFGGWKYIAASPSNERFLARS